MVSMPTYAPEDDELRASRKAVDISEKSCGESTPATLEAVGVLASHLRRRSMCDEAETWLRTAVARSEAAVGADHLDTLLHLHALANLLFKVKKLGESEHLYRRVLAGRRVALGDAFREDAAYFDVLNELAGVLFRAEEYASSLELYKQAVVGRTRELGPDHPDTLASVNDMAGLMDDLGELEEATEMYRRTLAARRRVLGVDDLDTLDSMTNLAVLLQKRGQPVEAEGLYLEALAGSEKMRGESAKATCDTAYNLGHLYEQGLVEMRKAAELYEYAYEGYSKTLGEDDPETVDAKAKWMRLHVELENSNEDA